MKQRGFTLIEIVVALVVIAVALGAVINTVGTNVSYSSYLKEKVLAGWVAQNSITEIRLVQEWPASGRSRNETAMAGKKWYVERDIAQTPDANIMRVDLTVYSDKKYQNNVVTITSYINMPFKHAN